MQDIIIMELERTESELKNKLSRVYENHIATVTDITEKFLTKYGVIPPELEEMIQKSNEGMLEVQDFANQEIEDCEKWTESFKEYIQRNSRQTA